MRPHRVCRRDPRPRRSVIPQNRVVRRLLSAIARPGDVGVQRVKPASLARKLEKPTVHAAAPLRAFVSHSLAKRALSRSKSSPTADLGRTVMRIPFRHPIPGCRRRAGGRTRSEASISLTTRFELVEDGSVLPSVPPRSFSLVSLLVRRSTRRGFAFRLGIRPGSTRRSFR